MNLQASKCPFSAARCSGVAADSCELLQTLFHRIRIDKGPLSAARWSGVTKELFWWLLSLLCTKIRFLPTNMNRILWHLEYVICKLPNQFQMLIFWSKMMWGYSRLLWLQIFQRIDSKSAFKMFFGSQFDQKTNSILVFFSQKCHYLLSWFWPNVSLTNMCLLALAKGQNRQICHNFLCKIKFSLIFFFFTVSNAFKPCKNLLNEMCRARFTSGPAECLTQLSWESVASQLLNVKNPPKIKRKLNLKIVKLMDHTYACNNLTNFKNKTHSLVIKIDVKMQKNSWNHT